jgi:hypothetical protein
MRTYYITHFVHADTIVPGGVQGLDRYAAMDNNPVVYSDPSGYMPCNGMKCSEDGYNSRDGGGSKPQYSLAEVSKPGLEGALQQDDDIHPLVSMILIATLISISI